MLGWSIGAGMAQKRIHELVSFPCEFRFTAVATSGFVADLLVRVAGVLGREVNASEQQLRHSSQGAYESLTLQLWVADGDVVYAIYEAMRADVRVKYLL